MAIEPLPSLDRTSPTFKEDVDNFFATQLPTFSVEVEAARAVIVSAESTASAAASTATTKAGIATTGASTATTQAGTATTQAGVATAAAAAAAASAASITAQVEVAIHSAAGKTTPADADELGLADSAASFGLKKLTWANLKAGVFAAWGALTGAATGKTTPVDADAFAIMDSAASNATKKLTWADLKAMFVAMFAAKGANSDITSLTGLTSALYATGQGVLTLSGGSLKFAPFNGNTAINNGRTCTIPDAGLTLAATGLSAGVLYYIYFTASGGVANALEASTTAHAVSTTAGNKGTRIKSGDDARSFVGWAYCETAATFIDTQARRGVRSWFNDRGYSIAGTGGSITTAGNSFMEISSGSRAGFIVRAGDTVLVHSTSSGYTTSANNSAYSGIGLDGATTAAGDYTNADIANSLVGMSCSAVFEPAEGWHYVTPTMRTTGGFNGYVQSAIRGSVGR